MVIFEDRVPLVQRVVYLVLLAQREHNFKQRMVVRQLDIHSSVVYGPIGWFDGAAEAIGQDSGAGGIIKISDLCSYKCFLNVG
jgi:hypothetical protein